MNRLSKKRIISFLSAFLMLVIANKANSDPLPFSLLTENDIPIRVIISEPEAKKVSQFDESRTEQLNKLLRHFSIDICLDHQNSESTVLIDQKEVLSIIQNDNKDEIKRIYSFEPSVIYCNQAQDEKSDPDGFDVFLEDQLYQFSHFMEEFYPYFVSAAKAFPERTKIEKTELRFSGFGKAVQRITISFPANYVQENFPDALTTITESSFCKEIISGLVFTGAQKIGLLLDEDGKIVRITYDGKVGKKPEEVRKVALIWKCLRTEAHHKDSISLKTPSVTNADKDNVTIERDKDYTDENAQIYNWDIQIDHRAGKEDKKQTHFTADLKKNDALISGNIEYSVKRDTKNPKLKVIPDLTEENDGEYKGTIEIVDYSGKIEKNRYLVHVQLMKGNSVKWPGSEKQLIEFNQTESKQNEIDNKEHILNDTVAALIVQNLFDLPEEDLTYFSNEIPENTWLELIH